MGSSVSLGYGLLLTHDAILDALGKKTDYPASPGKKTKKKRWDSDTGERLSDVTITSRPALPSHQQIIIEIDGERYVDVIRITDDSYEIPIRPSHFDRRCGEGATWDKHQKVMEAIRMLHHKPSSEHDEDSDFDPYCPDGDVFMVYELFDMVCDETWTTSSGNNGSLLARPVQKYDTCIGHCVLKPGHDGEHDDGEDEDTEPEELLSEDEDEEEDDDYSVYDESDADGTITLKEILDQQAEFDVLRSKLAKMGFKDLQFVFQPLFHE